MSNFLSSAADRLKKKEYGILKNGRELLAFQSFISLDNSLEADVTSQPVEKGSFFSANKVASPAVYSVELALQGSNLELMQAIKVLEEEVKGATLVQILTPLFVTPNATVTKMSWVHKEFVGMLVVSLRLQEIKEVDAEYVNTDVKPIKKGQASNAGDVSGKNGGKIQSKETRQSVLTQLGL